MLAESILDLTALLNPPPTEAGVLGWISSVINRLAYFFEGIKVPMPKFTLYGKKYLRGVCTVAENKGYELELSDETMDKVKSFAEKTGRSEDEVVEFILFEFLRNQIHMLEKRAEEVNVPVNELVTMQFNKILEYLDSQENN